MGVDWSLWDRQHSREHVFMEHRGQQYMAIFLLHISQGGREESAGDGVADILVRGVNFGLFWLMILL